MFSQADIEHALFCAYSNIKPEEYCFMESINETIEPKKFIKKSN